MSKRAYDRRDPYEAIGKICDDVKAMTDRMMPKLSGFERATLHLQMGGTV